MNNHNIERSAGVFVSSLVLNHCDHVSVIYAQNNAAQHVMIPNNRHGFHPVSPYHAGNDPNARARIHLSYNVGKQPLKTTILTAAAEHIYSVESRVLRRAARMDRNSQR